MELIVVFVFLLIVSFTFLVAYSEGYEAGYNAAYNKRHKYRMLEWRERDGEQ